MGVLIASIAMAGLGLALWLAWQRSVFGWRIDTWACAKLERLRALPRGRGIEIDEREIPLVRRAQQVGYPLLLVTDLERGALLTLDWSR